MGRTGSRKPRSSAWPTTDVVLLVVQNLWKKSFRPVDVVEAATGRPVESVRTNKAYFVAFRAMRDLVDLGLLELESRGIYRLVTRFNGACRTLHPSEVLPSKDGRFLLPEDLEFIGRWGDSFRAVAKIPTVNDVMKDRILTRYLEKRRHPVSTTDLSKVLNLSHVEIFLCCSRWGLTLTEPTPDLRGVLVSLPAGAVLPPIEAETQPEEPLPLEPELPVEPAVLVEPVAPELEPVSAEDSLPDDDSLDGDDLLSIFEELVVEDDRAARRVDAALLELAEAEAEMVRVGVELEHVRGKLQQLLGKRPG